MDYLKISISIQPRAPWVDLFIDELGELGCESFEETEDGFNAYIPSKDLNPKLNQYLNSLSNREDIVSFFTLEKIPSENWNKVWETSFEPIIVGNWCSIKAPFHKNEFKTKHSVIIEPKMSFGTGHHETTFMMVQSMEELNLTGKNVLDMGSGTGILAILAKKMGAQYVEAIDIEKGAVHNCSENAALNNVDLCVKLGGKEQIPNIKLDVIFANINRNILIDQMDSYSKSLKTGGKLFTSGFLLNDEKVIMDCALRNEMRPLRKFNKENWLCLAFTKN
jgi:ribosomal protein L11 methyltransferase